MRDTGRLPCAFIPHGGGPWPFVETGLPKAELDSLAESADDAERGLDHGTFIPLKVAWPDADIPVVQLSLVRGPTRLARGSHTRAKNT